MTKHVATPRTKRGAPPPAASHEAVLEPAAPRHAAVEEVIKPTTKAAKQSKKSANKAELHGKKPKLIRDSFTLPESDYAIFKDLKNRCLASGLEVKKSELLRIALIALAKLNDAELAKAVKVLPRIKTGRPAKN